MNIYLKPHDMKSLVVSANDISVFDFITLISDIGGGELRAVSAALLLNSTSLEYNSTCNVYYSEDTKNYIQRYFFIMTERISETEALGLRAYPKRNYRIIRYGNF